MIEDMIKCIVSFILHFVLRFSFVLPMILLHPVAIEYGLNNIIWVLMITIIFVLDRFIQYKLFWDNRKFMEWLEGK